jgi:hypothetical protein
VIGQFHTPAALPPGKKPPVPIGDEARWASETNWTLWNIEKPLSPPGIVNLSKIAGKIAYVWCIQRFGPFTAGLTLGIAEFLDFVHHPVF